MKSRFVQFLTAVLCLGMLLSLGALPVRAEEAESVQMAENISGSGLVAEAKGFNNTWYLFDKDPLSGIATGYERAFITLEYAGGLGSVYIIFGEEYGEYTLINNDTGDTHICGREGYLHEFLDLVEIFGEAPASVTLNFDNGPNCIFEIYVYTPGQVPDYVQKWNEPAEGKADLVLFSAHGDDEQLFFAGILPYYAVERGYQVQVCYLTDHTNITSTRIHEMLNGLWAVGVRTYPVFGPYPDFFTESRFEASVIYANRGYSQENILGWITEQIRRFCPMVVVAHDFYGEYGHGQHMVYADLVAKALEITNDPAQYPESVEAYGTWDVPKAYFHLYRQNEIYLDWDQPMEKFGGMTPFYVSKHLGFECHQSQKSGFYWWIGPHESASTIQIYSPCKYGLYRSTVGEDVQKNDFFENLINHTEQAILDEQARLEEEARLAEEVRLAEEARKAAEEEARRQEQERLAREEEARLRAEQEAAEKAALQRRNLIVGAGVAVVLILAVILLIWRKKSRSKNF